MNGVRGVQEIRLLNPDALIVGVTSNPSFCKRFLSAGADVAVLRAGNEIEELCQVIRQKAPERQPRRDRPIVTRIRLTDTGGTSEVQWDSAVRRIIEKIRSNS